MSQHFASQLTLGIRRAVTLRPEATALKCGPTARTWRHLAQRISRLAAAFRAMGIKNGDRVAMLSHNTDRYVEYVFATLWAGAVAVPLNTRWAARELRDCIVDADPKLLLTDRDHLATALELGNDCAGISDLIVADSTAPCGLTCYEELIATHDAIDDAGRSGEDLACLFYTGGTTGRPKGVMLSHNNLMTNSLVAIANMSMTEATVHLHVSPLFHVAGGARLFSVTLAGGTHVVLPRFEPRSFLQTLSQERATLTIIVPTMLNALLNAIESDPELARLDLSALELLTYGASPMPEPLLRRAMALLPHVSFMQGYGMTECSPTISVLSPHWHRYEGPDSKLRSAGRPVHAADVAILDGEGKAVPHGVTGEVCVRGPLVMQGYWKAPELTAETLREGWLHTGDAGYLDADGFLFLVDRVKDMIVTGGENVYSAEVEAALYEHPGILECAVIGIPDATWGEAVLAVVVPKPDITIRADELDQICRGRIAGYKCPKHYEFRTEPLPKGGPGKILKSELRAHYWQSHDRQIN
jgi:long-chain acyl-CoA synthetase